TGRQVYLPVVDKSTHGMCFVAYRTGDPLRIGAYGISEPARDPACTECREIGELDLLFQPLIGFDRTGCRLGFGGGYHDRALAASPTRSRVERVGLAYGFQEVPSLPRESHDASMGWVVTEAGVIGCGVA
ncbi:MAG: 5-formyltetrahydrofolate cyclo-ligase, partial [Magnetococcales bacterium]|nr:5-formyltetrahydrofolate cyclo-ligase [Magnetococcales bacterium]